MVLRNERTHQQSDEQRRKMNSPIKISVVIPAKNRAHTLCRCIESVLAQTYPATEIIVVDDASTDRTKEVVDSYVNHGVIYTRLATGSGAQAARNHGIAIACCKWIAFQDSDDLWLPHKLAIQVDALRCHDFDEAIVVHGDGLKVNDTIDAELPLPVPLTTGKCYRQLLLRPAPMFQALLVSKDAILEADGLDNDCPSYQEWDTAIRLARKCEFIHIQQPLFAWICHAGETISKDYRRDVLGFAYVIGSHKQEIIAVHGHRAWRRLKMNNITRALSARLWSDAENMLRDEEWHPCFALARICARKQVFPSGASKVLRLMAI